MPNNKNLSRSEILATFERNAFARDLARAVVLGDTRKTENAARRARMKANESLCAILLATALRRGESGIDWPEYFRNADVAQ
jgi:hypothetical protein